MSHIPLPVPYAGRNSPKDIAARLWNVEGDAIPLIAEDVAATQQQLEEELDLPDFTLTFLNGLV